LILFNGQNAVANSPLFKSQAVQALDLNLQKDLDLGLLNIQPVFSGKANTPTIALPAAQVIPVHPTIGSIGGAPPRYAEKTLNAVAQGVAVLQGLGHYNHYALVLQTVPYADLHQALPDTLIEPVEPISHLITAGVYGTNLPPFDGVNAGLPAQIFGADGTTPLPLTTIPGFAPGNVLYTGVIVSLCGNVLDHVRGRMDNQLDVMVSCNQKDTNEQYRFRVVERFCLRLKDPTGVILLLFMDTVSA